MESGIITPDKKRQLSKEGVGSRNPVEHGLQNSEDASKARLSNLLGGAGSSYKRKEQLKGVDL